MHILTLFHRPITHLLSSPSTPLHTTPNKNYSDTRSLSANRVPGHNVPPRGNGVARQSARVDRRRRVHALSGRIAGPGNGRP